MTPRKSPRAQLQKELPSIYKYKQLHHTHTAMHDNGTAKQADDRISTSGLSQAVRGNSDLPARAWGAASTPPAAQGTKWRRTNEVPFEASWRTATIPRNVEAPSFPAAPPKVKTRSAHPTQLGGRRARPCRRVVLSGNSHAGRKPRKTHTRGVDRGETPRATNTSYVNRSLLACFEGLEENHASPSYPVCSPDTLRKPPPDTLKGPSENPQRNLASGPMGPVPPGPGGTRRRRAVDSAAC